MNSLCVILARGGSKGIFRKNIAPLCNKPLIQYTIEAAVESNSFSNIVVSTDCNEIAEISRSLGADTPFIRSGNLSKDHILSKDALRDAILRSEKFYNKKFDIIAELPCTSPLRSAQHISESMDTMVKNYDRCDSVVSLKRVNHFHPSKIKKIVDNKILDLCTHFEEKQIGRRQDTPIFFARNGAIFIMKRECIIDKGNRVGETSIPYIMDERSSINIDSTFDLAVARVFLEGL